MDVDWIVAIMVFVVFAIWSFSYYFTLFPADVGILKPAADVDTGRIMGFLSSSLYTVPVKVSSSGENNSVLYASSVWYYGTKNSTRVLGNGVSLDCRIIGDNLYWLANLSSGDNYFYIEFSDVNSPLNCSSTFPIVNETHVTPWTIEKKTLVSLSKINNMTNTSYDDFKERLGLAEDFNISMEWDGSSETYGLPIPKHRNIYSRKHMNVLLENMKKINITVRVW